MWFLDKLAERRIDEARARGDFDGLAGEDRPLQLDDLSLVPEELRSAYTLLKNAGYSPPEVRARQQITEVEALVRQATTPELARKDRQRLTLLQVRLGDRMQLDSVYASMRDRGSVLSPKGTDNLDPRCATSPSRTCRTR